MKQILAMTLCLLLAACGGGGPSAPQDPPEDPAPTEPSNPSVLTQVLEACVPTHLAEILAGLEMFQGFVDFTNDTPPFDITGSNPAAGTVTYGLDLDGDDAYDFTGAFAMKTANGTPINLVPIFLALGADATVEEVIDALPDDAQVETTFLGTLPREPAPLDPIQLEGVLTTQFVPGPGLPDLVSGDVESTDSLCRLRIVFEDIAIEDLLVDVENDVYPTGAFDVEVENATALLLGTVTFDGTNIVHVSIAEDGFLPLEYTFDLETEVLTPVP